MVKVHFVEIANTTRIILNSKFNVFSGTRWQVKIFIVI